MADKEASTKEARIEHMCSVLIEVYKRQKGETKDE